MMRFDPFREIEELAQRMDRSMGQPHISRFAPPVDVHEDERGLEIALDLPGITSDRIQIEVENQTLTVQAERRYERQEGRTAHRVERSYGSYIRSFSIPAKYDLSGVVATHNHGLLTLTIPRSEASQRRTIAVRSGEQQTDVQTLEAEAGATQTKSSQPENARTSAPQDAQPSTLQEAALRS